jgi:hypothetical protein
VRTIQSVAASEKPICAGIKKPGQPAIYRCTADTGKDFSCTKPATVTTKHGVLCRKHYAKIQGYV